MIKQILMNAELQESIARTIFNRNVYRTDPTEKNKNEFDNSLKDMYEIATKRAKDLNINFSYK